jgi:hypothetical protein
MPGRRSRAGHSCDGDVTGLSVYLYVEGAAGKGRDPHGPEGEHR